MRHLETADSAPAAVIVRAARIHTVCDDVPLAEAMLVSEGRILAVGAVADVERAAAEVGLTPEVRDFGAATIVPGFIDAHAHPLMYGQMLSWVDVSPERAASIPELVALLREAEAHLPAGVPLRAYGYEQRNLAERRHPTRFELDEVSTTREIYVMNASGHGGVVNSFTLEQHGVTRDTPNPEGGEFFRDADGELTGELSDAACNVLTGLHGVKIGHHGPNFHLGDAPAEHRRQLQQAMARFVEGGVTTIGDAQVTRRELATYLDALANDELPVRVSMYFLSNLLPEVLELGLTSPFGNAMLATAGIKFYADGTLGGWTAYFPEGYVGDPCRTGQLYHEPADYAALIAQAHAAGLQTATHAQSPTAIKMVVDAVEQAQRQHPREDARHRIEHCGLPDPAEVARMAELGIRPVNQTQHYFNWGEGVEQAIGTPGERFNPLGEFRDAGVPITISSDAPVAEPKPLEAIQVAVTRVTRRGASLGDGSLRISAEAALRAHTLEGAISLGRERELGSLEVGKRADFAVLGGDPLAVEPEAISSIPILATWVGGQSVYEREQ